MSMKTRTLILAGIAALSVLSASGAHATSELTLACQGAVTDDLSKDEKPEPVSMGLVVNFTNRTVHGFLFASSLSTDRPIPITGWTDTTIVFGINDHPNAHFEESIGGSIDRVTGDVYAVYTSRNDASIFRTYYTLKCKPKQRMF